MTYMEAMGSCVMDIRRLVGVRRVSHGMVEIKVLCFRWLFTLLKLVWKGFPGFA
jgi:hypothetical protein